MPGSLGFKPTKREGGRTDEWDLHVLIDLRGD